MKKEYNIPVGKILGGVMVFGGIAASVLADKETKKTYPGDGFIDSLIRSTRSMMACTPFIFAGQRLWSDKTLDIKIASKESDEDAEFNAALVNIIHMHYMKEIDDKRFTAELVWHMRKFSNVTFLGKAYAVQTLSGYPAIVNYIIRNCAFAYSWLTMIKDADKYCAVNVVNLSDRMASIDMEEADRNFDDLRTIGYQVKVALAHDKDAIQYIEHNHLVDLVAWLKTCDGEDIPRAKQRIADLYEQNQCDVSRTATIVSHEDTGNGVDRVKLMETFQESMAGVEDLIKRAPYIDRDVLIDITNTIIDWYFAKGVIDKGAMHQYKKLMESHIDARLKSSDI